MLSSDRLCGDFSALGVAAGQVVLLQSSLSSLGHVDGGADTVVAALRAVLGPGGTLAVPAYSPQNSDTSPQYRAAVAGMTAEEVARHRAAMTPYDPATTPSSGIGRIAERVRTLPGARRNAHPHTSFAAVGPLAAAVTDGHALDCLLGERSPLARLYDLGAFVLLLGFGYAKCTAFHLAEYRRTGAPPRRSCRAVVADARGRRWTEFVDVDVDDGDFARIGADFERACETRRGRVGHAGSRLFPIRSAVDHAATWLAAHRPATPS